MQADSFEHWLVMYFLKYCMYFKSFLFLTQTKQLTAALNLHVGDISSSSSAFMQRPVTLARLSQIYEQMFIQ